jgi:hypothetical protein
MKGAVYLLGTPTAGRSDIMCIVWGKGRFASHTNDTGLSRDLGAMIWVGVARTLPIFGPPAAALLPLALPVMT